MNINVVLFISLEKYDTGKRPAIYLAFQSIIINS